MFAYYPVLILLSPLAAGFIIGLLGRAMGPKAVRLGVAAEVISFALSLLVLYEVTGRGPQTIHLSPWNFSKFFFAPPRFKARSFSGRALVSRCAPTLPSLY